MRNDALTQLGRPPAPPLVERRSPGLTTRGLVVLLVMTHAPLILVWGAIPSAYQFGGVVATPLVLGFGGLVLVAYAIGFGGMARRIVHRGGHYAFVTHGLGATAGLGTAVLAALSYLALLASLLVLLAGSIKGLTVGVLGVDVPVGLCVVLAVAGLVVLERLRLATMIRVLVAISVTQAVVLLWFDGAALTKPAGGDLTFSALDPAWLLTGSFGLALCLAITSFVGSEMGAMYADEVADPRRTIPRSTLVSYLITTVVLVITGFAVSVAVGPEDVVAAAQGQLESQTAGAGQPFVVTVVARLIGAAHVEVVVELITAALILGALASCAMSCHSLARQVSGLARDGVLPRVLAPRRDARAPLAAGVLAPIAAGLIALVAVAADASTVTLYLATGGGLGIAGVITLVSLATIVWFLRRDEDEAGFFGWEGQVVAAGFAMVTTGFVFVYALIRMPDVLPDGATYGWSLTAAILGAFLGGMVWAFAVRAARPEALARLGRSRPGD
ncbi:amino acid permease [Cryptosporangium aurantiacum]|uniref:Amino acid transporter n=1 Tax=Cryptosporangium aurantiacum TaxID=134849 RepID=A0A1M7PJB1_9ACTN|nr:amino acid permease [Cryptosporangium aurantiacum]SHN17272.1 Amino acid transporter [Cryptosporangium aurantiacum]